MSDVRIVMCGDDNVGKSSLIACFVKGTFVENIQKVVPVISVPADPLSGESVNTVIVDTSADPSERDTLVREIRKANVICLVYADDYSCERVSLYWLPWFRSCGVNVPVVLCENKCDNCSDVALHRKTHEEMLPIMQEFKEVEACVHCSAKEHININELLYLCKRSVTHPLAPLWDSKEQCLKQNAVAALERIFFLCDKNKDGYLDDDELQLVQETCFGRPLPEGELSDVKAAISRVNPEYVSARGISAAGFITLNQVYAEKGRQETTWQILRTFHYTDSLSLHNNFLRPSLDVSATQSVELKAVGYSFLVDLFYLFDRDNDGALNATELDTLFRHTPGIPQLWKDCGFPECTVRNENDCVTYNGWLAQWSMMTLLDYKATLEYLAYLGFRVDKKGSIADALRVTKARKHTPHPRRSAKVDRNCFLCYVVGQRGSGKSSLMGSFLRLGLDPEKEFKPRAVVNSVEADSKQAYLVVSWGKFRELTVKKLQEYRPNEIEDMITTLDRCDVVCLCYDSSDPESFSFIPSLIDKYPQLKCVPLIFAATKADLDRQQQRNVEQPESYAQALDLAMPIHVSAAWQATSDLFAQIVAAAQTPFLATSRVPREESEPVNYRLVLAVTGFSTLVLSMSASLIWRILKASR